MATVEHCVMCFEALSARLERRTPLALSEVQSSFANYLSTTSKLNNMPVKNLAIDLTSESGNSTPSTTSSSSSSHSAAETTPASSTTSIPIQESPLFVTWNTMEEDGSHSLRGCVGTFEAQPLSSGVPSYSLTAALDDYRFNPISLREIPTLNCVVTLLTDFEDADDAMDWEIGVHGIRISFNVKGRRYGACYLPEVAPEQGWTKEETIVSLMRKGGWQGRKDKWREVSDMKVVRYRGEAASCDYETFKGWRDWITEQK